jgi:hypothetical protein
MSLIRKRPRDLIKLCHLSAKVANKFKASKINGNHIYSVLDTYSRGRFDDIVIEFQTQLPQIQDILRRMGPTTKELQDPTIDNVYKFQTDRLITKISNIKQNISIDLTPMEIARYLYKIGFITARKTLPSNKLDRRYFDEHPDLLKGHIGDMGYGWEIHPAYRGALNRGELQKWYETIDIVDES